MSGNSRSRLGTHFGEERRAGCREQDVGWGGENKMVGKPGEEFLKTF